MRLLGIEELEKNVLKLQNYLKLEVVANSEANFQFLSDADLNYIVSQIYNQIFKLVWTSIQWKAA